MRASVVSRDGRRAVSLRLLLGTALALLFLVAGCADKLGDKLATDSGAARDVDVNSPQVASTDLIHVALAAGEITAHQATVYRVQALFRDAALPDRFAGASAPDHAAVVQAWTQLDDMPEALADSIRPYFLRPTDAASIFAAHSGESVGADGKCLAAKDRRFKPASKASAGECANWISQSLLPAPFRVWACATPERTQGSQILGEKLQSELSGLLQRMVLERPLGMGPPLPDRPNHREHRDLDELIDIYILPTCALAPDREDHRGVLQTYAWGVAFPTTTSTPRVNTSGPTSSASSGYALIAESMLADHDKFLAVAVHEVFHVQQFARNVEILPKVSWFMESTATWAELFFGPESYTDAYEYHLPLMQVSPLELTATYPHSHQYQAHVWPLYMQQHAKSGADAIFSVWDRLADSSELFAAEHALKYINQHVPWDEHYPQFAAQLLNLRLTGDPVLPSFTHVDGRFPVNQTPDLDALQRQHRLTAAKDAVLDYSSWDGPLWAPEAPPPSGVPGLGHRYDRIVIEASRLPKSWGVKLSPDETLKATGKAASMELLIREKEGGFHRVAIDPTIGGEWCDVREVVVILSVPSATGHVEGTMTASIGEAPVCALGGDLKLTVSGDYKSPILQLPAPDTMTLQVSGNLVVRLGQAQERLKEGERVMPPGLQKRLGLPDPAMERFYPDAGSQWTVTGTMLESACARGSFDCIPRTTAHLTAGDPARIKLEVIEDDGELTLVGSVPVMETTTAHLPVLPGGPEVRTRHRSWPLVCHTRGGVGSQMHANFVVDLFLSSSRESTSLGGSRVAGENTVQVHCDNSWSPYRYRGEGGEASTMREVWKGEFTIGR